jgi:hypothetical protein
MCSLEHLRAQHPIVDGPSVNRTTRCDVTPF